MNKLDLGPWHTYSRITPPFSPKNLKIIFYFLLFCKKSFKSWKFKKYNENRKKLGEFDHHFEHLSQFLLVCVAAWAGAVWFSRRTDNAAPLFLIVSKIQKDDRYISNLEKYEHDLDHRIKNIGRQRADSVVECLLKSPFRVSEDLGLPMRIRALVHESIEGSYFPCVVNPPFAPLGLLLES